MTEGPIHAAVDLGASSGRVVAGRRAGGRIVLEEVHRFANRPVRLPDGLHWSLPELFGHALDGIGAAAARGPLAGIGVDAWGVDYALLDGAGAMLGLLLPLPRRAHRGNGGPRLRPGARRPALPRADRHPDARRINTGLPAPRRGGHARALAAPAERLAFVPDLVAYWLTGVLAGGSTCARRRSGLLDARTRRWALGLVARLGLPEESRALRRGRRARRAPRAAPRRASGRARPARPPPRGQAVRAGRDSLRLGVRGRSGRGAARRPSCRAAPGRCSGWSCPGRSWRRRPARPTSPTNVALDGTTRLLKNVMGLWLLQECRRVLGRGAVVRRPRDDRRGRTAARSPCSTPTTPSS